jgi:UDP:flavonoid glycosyltransferase YjiC (YdhE family)
MRIVLVGGGTGGHFYPLMAVAEAVVSRAMADDLAVPELYYVCVLPGREGAAIPFGGKHH